MPRKWQAEAPRVEVDDSGVSRWRIGDRWLGKMGSTSIAGASAVPGTWAEVDPACKVLWGNAARLYDLELT